MCAAFDAAHMPLARMGVRGSSPNQSYALQALVAVLVFLIPSRDRCAIPLLRSSHAPTAPQTRLPTRPRLEPIDFTSRHHSPDDPSHLVGQGYPHQHRRLACYHTGHPRACWSPMASHPAHNGTGADISRRRSVRSPIFEVRPASAYLPSSAEAVSTRSKRQSPARA
jgi:hypothetical protein